MASSRGLTDERHCSCRGGGPRAFTLVELLVVIVIVALLVAVLVPGLNRARQMAKSAICQSYLKQLWQVFHASSPGAALQFPPPSGWVDFVAERDADAVTKCPSDEGDRSSELVLGDVYLVQDPGGLTFYPVLDIIENGSMGLFQCEVFDRGAGVWEIWIGNYENTSVLANSDADAAVRVTLGGSITIQSLDPPGDGGPGDPFSCGSDHWLCHGPNMGAANWQQDVKRRLTGQSYHQVDEPYYVSGGACSYGMNNYVRQLGAPPGQLLLLDYEKIIADPVVDTISGEMKYLAPRHMGKVNGVFVDGSVRGLWPWEVDPAEPLWKP